MKGVVFCEFIEMVDARMSPEVTEKIISKSDLPSGGAYTSVGTYDHNEIISLVAALSEETGVPVPKLVNTFGNYLFGRFVKTHEHFFKNVDGCFKFLENVNDYIHVEVLKLYPDAELPQIKTVRKGGNTLDLTYRSGRGMADLAEGLIEACINHFNENIELTRKDLDSEDGNQVVLFTLIRS